MRKRMGGSAVKRKREGEGTKRPRSSHGRSDGKTHFLLKTHTRCGHCMEWVKGAQEGNLMVALLNLHLKKEGAGEE